jgi:uncharacterized membrane protein (UPF0136 family)
MKKSKLKRLPFYGKVLIIAAVIDIYSFFWITTLPTDVCTVRSWRMIFILGVGLLAVLLVVLGLASVLKRKRYKPAVFITIALLLSLYVFANIFFVTAFSGLCSTF